MLLIVLQKCLRCALFMIKICFTNALYMYLKEQLNACLKTTTLLSPKVWLNKIHLILLYFKCICIILLLIMGWNIYSKKHWEKSHCLVQLVDLSPVGFGPLVFWSSCCLVKLSFSRAGFVRPDGGWVVWSSWRITLAPSIVSKPAELCGSYQKPNVTWLGRCFISFWSSCLCSLSTSPYCVCP
jgi:hypothetical protein